jgi:hypothetical protein
VRAAIFLFSLGLVLGCGTPSADAPGPLETLPPDSSADMALEFDGSNDYASLGTAGFPFARLPHTISFWVSASGGAAEQTIVALNKDDASGVFLGLSNGVPNAKSSYDDVFVQGETPLASGWHHVAYLFDGTDTTPHHTLYVDGEVVGTGTALPQKRTPNTAYIGSDAHQERCFKGTLDDLRIFAAARTREQIVAEIAGEGPEQEPPELVLHLTFDEASGPRVVDRSGRGNHALLGDGMPGYMPQRVLSGVMQARATLARP